MIRSLKLENFRRHESTYIDFSPESQIVAITGRNGAGKSTMLEAIVFALYGETRHGRRGMAGLVRRGAEHEGMGVTCEFTVAGVLYRVERRWEKNKHSAALYANNTLHTQTADGVTAAITALLGMDAVGFRLATIARQKELDGLAEMSPAVRRKTISRLLRLDAVQAASLKARETHKTAKSAALTLTGAANVTERRDALAKATQMRDEAAAAHADAAATVRDLDARIGATSDLDEAYRDAQIASASAAAARDAALAESTRAHQARDRHVVPDPVPAPAQSLEEVSAALHEVNDVIARGRAQAALATQLASSTKRVEETRTRLEELRGERTELATRLDDGQLAEAADAVSAAEQSLNVARSAVEAALRDAGRHDLQVTALRERLAALDEVGATCDTCGQDVGDEHRAAVEKQLTSDLTAATTARDEAKTAEQAATAARDDATRVHREAVAAHAALVDADRTAAQLTERIGEGERALAVYENEIARLGDQVEDIDLDATYAEKTRLEAAKAEAQNAAHAELVRINAVEKANDLDAAVAAADQRLEAAAEAFAAAAPAEDLVAAWNDRQDLIASRAAEREFLEALAADLAGAQARVESAEQALADTQRVADKISEHRTRAEVAAKTSTLLEAVGQRLATQVRPQLEGQISALLQLTSEGRFTGVKVSDDYEITVCDHDGKYYPVSEFSGGEGDLIALATRLALAQVVATRHGAGGAGFLILDEVFGSQDDGRRFAILEALRRLRGTYGQILLISHVGGIEDAADMVLEVGKDDEDEVARLAVLAG